MKIQRYRPPELTEIPKIPKGTEWISAVLAPRDRALKDHAQALTNRLTFEENLNAEVRDVEVFHNVEVELTLNTLNGPAIGVFLVFSELEDYAKLKWRASDADTLRFTVKWDSAPSAGYTVRLVIIGR